MHICSHLYDNNISSSLFHLHSFYRSSTPAGRAFIRSFTQPHNLPTLDIAGDMLPLSTLFLALMAITSVSASPIPFSQTGQSVPSGQLTSRNTPAPRFHSDIHLQQSVPRKRLSSSEKALLYRPRKRLDVLAKRQEAPAEGGAGEHD
jgi:hypothetical protein